MPGAHSSPTKMFVSLSQHIDFYGLCAKYTKLAGVKDPDSYSEGGILFRNNHRLWFGGF
jgi:hypothetical protein